MGPWTVKVPFGSPLGTVPRRLQFPALGRADQAAVTHRWCPSVSPTCHSALCRAAVCAGGGGQEAAPLPAIEASNRSRRGGPGSVALNRVGSQAQPHSDLTEGFPTVEAQEEPSSWAGFSGAESVLREDTDPPTEVSGWPFRHCSHIRYPHTFPVFSPLN